MSDNREVDVIVLGVGTSGEDLSLRLLDAGLEVAGVEDSLVGGQCAYWACLPTKMMIRAANLVQEGRRIEGMAGDSDISPDWTPVAQRVREATGGWDDSGAVQRYRDRGGLLFHQRGKLVGPRTVQVGDETVTARRGVVIATGSHPTIPPVSGIEEVDYWTNHDVIQLEQLPESLVVMGGGVVGCELSELLARFGVDVTIVEAGERLLANEEPEASQLVESALSDSGIDVRTEAAAKQVRSSGDRVQVMLADGTDVDAQHLLVATGRAPTLDGLGLESAGLDPDVSALEVDERMHVADGIWAMGDVTGVAMFTHVGLYQSAIIAADVLGEEVPPARYDAVPRAVFTDPQVGAVGLTEAEARQAGRDVTVVRKQLPATFRGWVDAEESGIIKLLADRDSGALVGATAVGSQANEMLGMLTLAVHRQVPIEQLRSMIYAFPTFHGAIGEALGAYGRGVTTVMDPGYEGVHKLDEL